MTGRRLCRVAPIAARLACVPPRLVGAVIGLSCELCGALELVQELRRRLREPSTAREDRSAPA